MTAPLTVVALLAAFFQLRRTRSAVRAATEASRQTELRVVRNHAMLLIADLERVTQDMEPALDQDDGKEVGRLLNRWRLTGISLRGQLRTQDLGSDELMRALTISFTLATTAKMDIRKAQTGLDEATVSVRKSMERTVELLGDLSADLKTRAGR